MKCSETYLYLRKKTVHGNLLAFVPSRCKSWSCPVCRPIKAKRVKQYIIDNFTREPIYMMTLTFYHSGKPLDCWLSLGQKWNRMRTYLAKKYGKFNYIRIVEPHKEGGWPHMHILVEGFQSLPKADDQITKWGFGWNYQCQRMPVKDAARYVAKYLTKEWPTTEADVHRVASKCRVVSVSRGMPPIFRVESDWDVVQYDEPSGNAHFLCNSIIHSLKSRGAGYISAKPFGGGFIIHSDLDIVVSSDLTTHPHSAWDYCKDFEYLFMPAGWQMEMFL